MGRAGMKRLLHPSQWNYLASEAMQTLLGLIIWVIALTALSYGCRDKPSDDYHPKGITEYDSYGEYMMDYGYDVCYDRGGGYPC